MSRTRVSAKQAGVRWESAIVAYRHATSGARPDPGRRRVHRGSMTRLILTLILAVAISAAVLLFGVLWESDATDYPEGNVHE